MKYKLGQLLKEVCIKTTVNNQHTVLTSSKSGIFIQDTYFNKNVASKDNTGYKIIKRGQFTYRSMSDSGYFFINCLTCCDIGIVSPAYPVFEILNEKIVDREYLSYFFKSPVFNEKISLLSRGSTRLSLKYKDLKSIEIELPSLEEQKKIALQLNKIQTMEEMVEKQLRDIEELRELKMQEYFD